MTSIVRSATWAPPQGPTRRRKRRAGRVLVVDPDEEMRVALSTTLAGAGYAVDAVGTAADALRQARIDEYSLVILDLVLPDADGRALLGNLLAARPHQVVLVLTGVSDTATKINCLEKGARDYLTKPFSPRELLVRMRLRLEPFAADWSGHVRSGDGRPGDGRAAGDGPCPLDSALGGRLHLDMARLTADTGHGPVRLTRTEFLLLTMLAEHAGRPIPTKRLLTEVWGYGFEVRSNVVGVCVQRLRSKLGARLIETVRGEGYRLVSEIRREQRLAAARRAGS